MRRLGLVDKEFINTWRSDMIWFIEEMHSRMRAGWSDYYLVEADDALSAKAQINIEGTIVECYPIDFSVAQHIGESSDGVYAPDALEG